MVDCASPGSSVRLGAVEVGLLGSVVSLGGAGTEVSAAGGRAGERGRFARRDRLAGVAGAGELIRSATVAVESNWGSVEGRDREVTDAVGKVTERGATESEATESSSRRSWEA